MSLCVCACMCVCDRKHKAAFPAFPLIWEFLGFNPSAAEYISIQLPLKALQKEESTV